MFGLKPEHIVMIGIVALLLFGPSQLPALGRSFGDFFKEMRNVKKELKATAKEIEQQNRED